jgi:hypothetical protein
MSSVTASTTPAAPQHALAPNKGSAAAADAALLPRCLRVGICGEINPADAAAAPSKVRAATRT